MKFARAWQLLGAGAVLALSLPAHADVKTGVDAWSRGDYAAAVREWRGPADKGDADAQFNMAQAYRLGRGVQQDQKQAEVLYAKAAAQGHLKAADNYGLLLFQDGRREEAMPYVKAAAERGDPRAQYLLGIAHFNGDLVPKDWVRAYALLTLANSAGLPQAAQALKQMDDYIPMAQRQQAQSLAQQIKRDSDATRTQQLAAADLAAGQGATSAVPPPMQTGAPARASAIPAEAGRIPQAIPRTPVSPSVVAAQAAIAEASRVTGTQTPLDAGADYARPTTRPMPEVAASASAQPRPAPRQPAPTRVASAAPAPAPAPTSSDGPWRVQLGAFSVAGNAERMWRNVSGLAALAGKSKIVIPGRLTKLQAGGFASRGAAQQACDAVKSTGRDCLVTR